MPFQTSTPQLSDEYKDLTNRERELSRIAAETDPEKKLPNELIAAMWKALADDYAAECHNVAAERCQRKAERLTWA